MILKPISKIIVKRKIKKANLLKNNINAYSKIAFEEIKSVLIISPNNKSEKELSEESVSVIKNQFIDVEAVFLSTSDFPEKSLSVFGYPNAEFLKRFQSLKFDLIIDLNKSYSLINTFIISHMQPSIRIKIYNDKRNDEFYNFIFKSQKKRYVEITRHCITMLHHILAKNIIM